MRNKSALLLFVMLFASVGLVSGCSGIKTYPNEMKKNLFIETETDSGVRVSMDVYKIDSKCQASYEGTVFVKGKRADVGLPTGKSSYIVFNFARSSFWTGKSNTGYDTLLRPKKGKVYKAKAIYEDDMYNVEIRESGSRKSKGREIEQKPFSACKPL